MRRTVADMKTMTWWVAVLVCVVGTPSLAQTIDRSWHVLTTGNGHGFQVFDRTQGRLVDFLEHPYHFLAP